MTRKRTRESLEISCASPVNLRGARFVKTAETVCYEVFREIMRQSRQFECKRSYHIRWDLSCWHSNCGIDA